MVYVDIASAYLAIFLGTYVHTYQARIRWSAWAGGGLRTPFLECTRAYLGRFLCTYVHIVRVHHMRVHIYHITIYYGVCRYRERVPSNIPRYVCTYISRAHTLVRMGRVLHRSTQIFGAPWFPNRNQYLIFGETYLLELIPINKTRHHTIISYLNTKMAAQIRPTWAPRPCPVCKEGFFHSFGRLLQHEPHCRGPCGWDQTQQGIESRNRQYLEEYEPSETLAQQRRRLTNDFHQPQESGRIRTHDRVAGFPSIANLAASVDDRDVPNYHFVTYDGDDNSDEQVTFENNNDVAQDITDNTEVEKSSVRRRANLPPSLLYQIEHNHIMHSHRRIDLNLGDELNRCTQKYAKHHGVNFGEDRLYTRDELIKKLAKTYNLHGLKPDLRRIKLTDDSEATVPVFDVKAMLLKFLNDPSKMNPENIAPNFDIFTGKPIEPSSELGEIHTGSAWEIARENYCGADEDALAMGLVVFYDKTHSDCFGSLAVAPLIAVPTWMNEDCRNNVDFHMVLGYIPNLSHGKGKSNRQTSQEKLQDEHNCLRLITDQIKKIQEDGGIWTEVMGKKVCVKLWIHIVAGDTSGHNNICGHFNASNSAHPYRDCPCGLHDLSNAIPECMLFTIEDLKDLSKKELNARSKHKIDNAFDEVPLSDLIHGILGVCPAEMLHVCGNGIYKYQFECICELVGPNTTKQKEKDQMDALHQHLVNDARRQSDRDFPRMTIRNGATDGTKLSATERLGNLFGMLCVAHTTEGIAVLRPGWSSNNIGHAAFRDCMKLQLAFDKWVNDPHETEEVEDSTALVGEMIDAIKKCFPRLAGNGWDIPKMHSLAKMTHYMLKFGVAKNFSGQIGERVLKTVVKEVAENTQRRPSVFAEQCAQRMYEQMVLNHAMEDVKHKLHLNWSRESNNSVFSDQGRGVYRMTFGACDHNGVGTIQVKWADKSRQRLGVRVSNHMALAIKQFAFDHGWRGQFSVRGYTSMKLNTNHKANPVLFHATELTHGGLWYDYGMVRYADGDNSECLSPGQILGFFKFEVPGMPTPHHINDEGLTADQVFEDRLPDDHMYAVVHSATKPYLTWEKIRKEFIVPFKMGSVSKHLYVVKVENITDALFVFKDYGGRDKTKRFCVLPYRQWGDYFSDRIYDSEDEENDDEDD